MPDPQIIRTTSGEELVVLTRAEYDALVKAAELDADAEDVAIFDARMADLQAGRDAVLPGDVSAAMLRGDTLLKALRRWRGMTQGELAEKTGLGQGYISDIESGRRRGPPHTLGTIAIALKVPIAYLHQATEPAPESSPA